MSKKKNTERVEIDIDQIVFETDAGMIVDVGGTEHWLPKSEIEIVDEYTIAMPEWLAYDRGLI